MVKHIFSLAIAFAGASLLFLTTMVLITPNSQIHYQRLIASFLGVPELCLVRKMERRLPLTRSATIPARVWQLEPDENVTVTVNNAMQSWDDVNGESIQVVRHDRIAGQALLSDLYGSKMRWDLGFLAWSTPQLESLWSLTALYSRGGIFAASNIQCRVPVSHWFRKDSRESSQKGMLGAGENLDNENDDVHSAALDFGRISWRDCSLVVALDDANPSLFNDQVS